MPQDITRALRRLRGRREATSRPIIREGMAAWRAEMERRMQAMIERLPTVKGYDRPRIH